MVDQNLSRDGPGYKYHPTSERDDFTDFISTDNYEKHWTVIQRDY